MTMTHEDVVAAKAAYHAIVGPLARDRSERKVRGEKHPMRDFLFEYYSFKPYQLLRWSPGLGVTLSGIDATQTDWPEHFCTRPEGITLDAAKFPARRRTYLEWAITYLKTVQAREPFFGCFGLHEWAMVYHETHVRHDRVPLRLASHGTDAVVETTALKCTHFDAYRFFTPDAVPRNRQVLTRPEATTNDQPACVHVVMDLYKFTYKIAPYCASTVMAEAFQLALQARTLDMRASPYDMRAYGLDPISIETREGREEYVREQRALCEQGYEVRQKVLDEYKRLQIEMKDQ
jgi:hypothetical protein